MNRRACWFWLAMDLWISYTAICPKTGFDLSGTLTFDLERTKVYDL